MTHDSNEQFHLGRRYTDGDGVPKDTMEAAKWYRMAAEQGHTEAQFCLGRLYDKGGGALPIETELKTNIASGPDFGGSPQLR